MAEAAPEYDPTDTANEPDPTDLDRQWQQALKQGQHELAEQIERRRELVWLLSGPRGRRMLRRELRDAGFYIEDDTIETRFDRHYGQMAFNEGVRLVALRTLWLLLRLVATRQLQPEAVALLMTDEDKKT